MSSEGEKPNEKQTARQTLSAKTRSKIEEQIERAHELRKREQFAKRLEIARAGLRDYEAKRFTDAAKAFHLYLKVLEEWKGVESGGLMPANFDATKDKAELVLISGVYWDLAKLYDRTKSEKKRDEFKKCLDKYVIFSKNTAVESLCAESLRKYISNEKPIHKKEFAEAYKRLGGKDCVVASALVEHISMGTIENLRLYRDNTLRRSLLGRAFIWFYYTLGPINVFIVKSAPQNVQRWLAKKIDQLALSLF